MNARNSPVWSVNFILVFLFFADALAWLWAASTVGETFGWLVTGDRGGSAQLCLCGLSFLPIMFVWSLVMLCDSTESAAKTLGYLSAIAALSTAFAVILLFVLPFFLTGGKIPHSIFPQAFPPYSWGELGSILQWLALNLVFPYGPYLGYFSLAVLLFYLTCRPHLFGRRVKLVGWVLVASCGVLFFTIAPVWTENLVWFYYD